MTETVLKTEVFFCSEARGTIDGEWRKSRSVGINACVFVSAPKLKSLTLLKTSLLKEICLSSNQDWIYLIA